MAISPANVLPILNTCEHEVANLCNVEWNEYFLQAVMEQDWSRFVVNNQSHMKD